MKAIAVIPARAGSKGIPRKNMRLMKGRPLIAYAIQNALACAEIDEVVVTSDSEEVIAFAGQFEGVTAMRRAPHLSGDAVTLDPVVYDAVIRCEKEKGCSFEAVITLQPTSPLLSSETLGAALRFFDDSNASSVISVVNDPHLSWKEQGGSIVPAYERRVNRQELPANYVETGAFVISCRAAVTADDRLGQNPAVFEVPYVESVDIDTTQDWMVCESMLSRKSIVFRVDGYGQLGLGHIYRALTLAYALTGHEVTFLCLKEHRDGIDKLRSANMKVVEVDTEADALEWVAACRPDIFVNDRLDTDSEYVRRIKGHVGRFVSFEDLGEGRYEADAVVNALYKCDAPLPNVFAGEQYVCLRDEFISSRPICFSEAVERILVLFGGTDPGDYSSRIYEIAKRYNRDGVRIRFDFILGPGYKGKVQEGDSRYGISVFRDVVRVADLMQEADMAISSQGRTTFELAAMGLPAIVLAQNERELLHSFAQINNGFINLGLGYEVSDDDIYEAICWLISARSVRREMHRLMLSTDLKSGIHRVVRILLGDEG